MQEQMLLSHTAAQLGGGSGPETIAVNPETTLSRKADAHKVGPVRAGLEPGADTDNCRSI